MFKTHNKLASKLALVTFCCMTFTQSSHAQSVLDMADKAKEQKLAELNGTDKPQKQPSPKEIARSTGSIPLSDIELVGVYGIDSNLTAEVTSNGVSASLSMNGQRTFGGWELESISPGFVKFRPLNKKRGKSYTLYLSAQTDMKAVAGNAPSVPAPQSPPLSPISTGSPIPPIPVQ